MLLKIVIFLPKGLVVQKKLLSWLLAMVGVCYNNNSSKHQKSISTMFLLFTITSFLSTKTLASTATQCEQQTTNACYNKSKALPLKLIGIASILITSILGVSLPLLTRSVPTLSPDRSLFIIVKAFASGIILATGFMHVLPDSFDMLRSSCLADNPWHKFPFTGFVAMLSAVFTLMVDSMATSVYTKSKNSVSSAEAADKSPVVDGDHESGVSGGHFHGHAHAASGHIGSQLLRYRVVAMVLELGIVVHSIVIGLGVGASNDTCTIKPLIAALCFHQLFEGMGLGGCILQAEYKKIKKLAMVFFFSITTHFGIALGIGLSKTYKENSPNALITVGLLNASSSGLLIYMAMVDLLAAEFMGPKLQGSIRLQIKCYVAVLLGAGGMSIMAKWA